ncbi:MAG: multicopper oxidase [Gammaproteobacteria bacterium]|nr:multicopper oxidase [Gammaproteobacteria bacterium]
MKIIHAMQNSFVKTAAFGAAVLVLGAGIAQVAFAVPPPGGNLNPRSIPKYVSPLVIPPEMPQSATNQYDIEVVPHNQQILPLVDNDGNPLSATPVWTYGTTGTPATRNYPAFTIEATTDVNAEVIWRNNLVDAMGNPLPHLLSVDRSLHWANTEELPCADGSGARTDCRPDPAAGLILQQPYTGPVPIITHVHGAHVGPESDGYPEAWYLPPNPPAGFAPTGRLANQFGMVNTVDGVATFNYPNDQPSTTLWYHDHTLGMTRLNVYAGPAGFWLIRNRDANGNIEPETGLFDGTLPGPAPDTTQNPFDATGIFEIPIVIQDRSFNVDAAGNTSLFYPDNRAFFEGLRQAQQLRIPFIGDPVDPSDIPAIWNPEAFFNVMVVNGVSWPFLNVEPQRYRLRLLNGCNSRFLNLAMFVVGMNGKITNQEVPFFQIGAEQGLLPQVVRIETGFATPLPGDGTTPALMPAPDPQQALLMGLAERADVIVDFTGMAPGTRIRMINTAPDAPFGGFPDVPADPGTTGQVMEFVVGADNPLTPDSSTPPAELVFEDQTADPPVEANTQTLALLEEVSEQVCVSVNPAGRFNYIPGVVPVPPQTFEEACIAVGGVPFGPKAAVLGTVDAAGFPSVQLWGDQIAQNPALNSTEVWELYNASADAHPIHLHLVKFEVMDRQDLALDPLTGETAVPISLVGAPMAPSPTEAGFKDTVIALPGQVTRLRATFDIPGLYVWHCHIVEHEDNEMMVPYCVGDSATTFCGPQAPPPMVAGF